jgi:hypothetical protein
MTSTQTSATPNINAHSLVERHPDLIAAEADGEVLMLDVESGNYFGLNEVASFVWLQLETPLTVSELCARVQSEFEVDEARCLEDLIAHLSAMMAEGLVQAPPEDPGKTTTSA